MSERPKTYEDIMTEAAFKAKYIRVTDFDFVPENYMFMLGRDVYSKLREKLRFRPRTDWFAEEKYLMGIPVKVNREPGEDWSIKLYKEVKIK